MPFLLSKILMLLGLSNYVVRESKFVVIKSEMSESMKRHALGTAMVAFEEPGIPANSKMTDIAEKLTNEFNSQYGRHWFCLVGPPGFVSHFDYTPNSLLWFSYKDIQVIMFKLAKVSQSDIIREARRTDKSRVRVLDSEMDETKKAYAITAASIAFQEYNSFEAISANISGVFDQIYDEYWQCVIGSTGMNARFTYVPGNFISFTFGEAQVVLFQIMKQIEPHEVITKARSSLYHPIIDYNSMATHQRNQVVRVAIENIYRYENFVDIARGITASLASIYGIHWSCVVGHHLFHSEDLAECHTQAVSVHFSDLRVLLCTNEGKEANDGEGDEHHELHHDNHQQQRDFHSHHTNLLPPKSLFSSLPTYNGLEHHQISRRKQITKRKT